MDESRLDSILVFASAARLGSILAAARENGTSAATISRRISRLEERLETRLLTRTTRRIVLTEAGQVYLENCQVLLRALDEVDLSAPTASASLSGRLRVAAPAAFGRCRLAPVLIAFTKAHPNLELDILLSDARIDLIDQNVDVAIRMAHLADSAFIARKIGDNRRYLCASPSYLEKHGVPRSAGDLRAHDAIVFDQYDHADGWKLSHGGKNKLVRLNRRLCTSDIELVFQFALAGLGIAILPAFLADDAFTSGALRQVLPDYDVPESAIYALYPSRRFVSTKTKRFIEFLSTNL